MPQFVLLHHEISAGGNKPSHWDFMLERDGKLLTWSLPQLPRAWQSAIRASNAPLADKAPNDALGVSADLDCVPAERLSDHRIEYLDYQGALTRGRGQVVRIDRGTYYLLLDSPDALSVKLSGSAIVGHAELFAREDANIAEHSAWWTLHWRG